MRISKNTCIGIDAGTNGAIVVTCEGSILQAFPFGDRIQQIGINQLTCLDANWLQGTLNNLRKINKKVTLETPKLITYGGNIKVDTICKLQQQVAQLYHACILAGFEVVCADPQNWQGYHSLFTTGGKSIKNIVMQGFIQWHEQHDSLNQTFKQVRGYSRERLSGIADAWAISQYEYQEPIVGKRGKSVTVAERKKKMKIVQPEVDSEFAMF